MRFQELDGESIAVWERLNIKTYIDVIYEKEQKRIDAWDSCDWKMMFYFVFLVFEKAI